MIRIDFYEGLPEELMAGVEMVSAVRGFETGERGVKVLVKKGGNGLLIKGENGEYTIEYEKRNEFFRAVSITAGLIEKGKKDVLIREKSAFEMCGAMIDCSRDAVLKSETVKDIIVRMAMVGMNTLMLYTEDIYELEGYEYFGYLRGRYTGEEIKEFDRIASVMGIELVPCIQTLAHLSKTLRWEYAAGMKDDDDILLIDEDKTYEFIESMFKTWRKYVSSDKIHIGMDEAEGVGLGKYFDKHGCQNRFDIMTRHVNRVCSIAEKYGFKPMMWSDMYFKIGSKTRFYYDPDTYIPENISEKIPRNVSMVYWDYYHYDKEIYQKMIENHKKLGREIIFAGGAWCFRGLCPQYRQTFDTTFPALSVCRREGIKNVFLTTWGDDGGEVNIYTMLLAFSLFAEFNFYEDADTEHIKEYYNLCTGYDAEFLLAFCFDEIEADKDERCIALSKQVFFQSVLLGLFDKNFECYDIGGFYNKVSERLESVKGYKEPVGLYDYYSAMLDILKIKWNIGIDLRKAYKNNDTKLLEECSKKLEKLITLYEVFHEKLYILWHQTNKPFGFMTFERRIGAMIQELKTAKRKTDEFILGKTDKIEELEEEILWYGGKGSEGKLLSEHFYNAIRL